MILVNDPGDRSVTYTQLLHSPWNGFTFADTIFPAFLWIAGFASVLSLRARAGHGASRASLLGHAARRALILFACGLLLEGFPYFELAHYQLTGVLQKIAVSYFCAFAITLVTGWRGQLLALLGLFVGYIAFMLLTTAPDCVGGAWSAACNGARRLDSALLSGHLWLSAAGNDPDGIIGTLAGVVLGLLVAFNIDVIVPAIERLLHVSFLPSSVYLISRMPSDPQQGDIVPVAIISLVLAFLATLYPSWRASRLQPAEALRYE